MAENISRYFQQIGRDTIGRTRVRQLSPPVESGDGISVGADAETILMGRDVTVMPARFMKAGETVVEIVQFQKKQEAPVLQLDLQGDHLQNANRVVNIAEAHFGPGITIVHERGILERTEQYPGFVLPPEAVV